MPYYLSNPVVIVDYDPDWPLLYAQEKRELLNILGSVALEIEHIGSTSIPGCGAKPILDIAVGINALSDIDPCVEKLRELGYEDCHIDPKFARRMFSKGPFNEGTRHLQFSRPDSVGWQDAILFRDYLRSHPELAEEYTRVKREAAARHGNELWGYYEDKGPWIESVMAKARQETAAKSELKSE